ncbi:MAG TPA: branched-chain amino acid ABC transporter permease [Thermoanaerobaculia bacterium]|jgi:branched-chain amino acid transport system permease protein
MIYLDHLVATALIYGLLAMSLDLIVVECGLLSVAHASFFGVGAYAVALLGRYWNMGAVLASAVGIALILSVCISWPAVRLHGDFYVLATFAFQSAFSSVLTNWTAVTRGPAGIADIRNPFRLSASNLLIPALIGLSILIVALFVRVGRSPFGEVIRSVRDDEVLVAAAGYSPAAYRIRAVAIGAVVASTAGCAYAYQITYVDPSSFTIADSILMLAMVVVASEWRWIGPWLGAGLFVIVPEVLRFTGFAEPAAALVRQMIFGGLLVSVAQLARRRRPMWMER